MRRKISLLVIVFCCAWASAAVGQTSIYTGATVIVGVNDDAIFNATIVVVDGKIQRIASGAVDVPGAVRHDLTGRFVMPGLIDAHVHISDFGSARRALLSGVTTARSMGAAAYADIGLRELARAGRIDAPEMVASGYHVRPDMAEGFFLDHPALGDLLAGGVGTDAAVRRVVRAQLDRGVNFIKTNATERAGLPNTDPRKQLYDEAQLRAMVQEAASLDVPVAAHAHGDGGGRAAVAAGVRSIEHGTYLSEQTLAMMAERGTYLVPTIAVVRDLTLPGGDYDNPILEVRGRHMLPRVREMAATAKRLGVKLVAATDTGYGPNGVLRLSHELIELVDVGLSPIEAIRSATSIAAELLGVDDHTGRLIDGYDADFIVMDRDPRVEIGAVQDLLMVVNNGKIVVNRTAF
jgi:imidazolonepropionase-like amidohydrolase